ncbi:rhodanese-like domain-containing protein 15, chloroplastic isoform X2 [Durio zibethinus]|uniref:Rhodanese-like domain-containing protein 15, chloroplastic isoform X2 n=1 Tax=Durio zibethinus TaxID=66656 RepID=A0A6P6BEE6_DURZI|nr:rhodanese-like domain-containing protein 15, chloroplastic isoform X2 [Durio zibethinus]
MEATSLFSSSCFTASSPPSALCPPQNLDHRGLFSLTVNRRRCQISVVGKKLSFCQMAVLRGNVRATGVPTSVPVRVAHELHQAGHRYLDVRTPEEFIAGHAPGAINIPYMYKVGSGVYSRYGHCWRVCGLDSESASNRMMILQANCGE